jgi:hypothetical protein
MTLIPTFCGEDCGGNACQFMAVAENGRVRRYHARVRTVLFEILRYRRDKNVQQ